MGATPYHLRGFDEGLRRRLEAIAATERRTLNAQIIVGLGEWATAYEAKAKRRKKEKADAQG